MPGPRTLSGRASPASRAPMLDLWGIPKRVSAPWHTGRNPEGQIAAYMRQVNQRGRGRTRGQHPWGYYRDVMWGRNVMCERGRTKGVARTQPRGDKGLAMRGGCCTRMGGFPKRRELAKVAKNTYYVRETRWAVRRVNGEYVVPSHSRGGGEGRTEPEGRNGPRWGQRRRARWPGSRAIGPVKGAPSRTILTPKP